MFKSETLTPVEQIKNVKSILRSQMNVLYKENIHYLEEFTKKYIYIYIFPLVKFILERLTDNV